jgi:hypothetical protein
MPSGLIQLIAYGAQDLFEEDYELPVLQLNNWDEEFKLLEDTKECIVMYVEINKGDKYLECNKCYKVFCEDIKNNWINKYKDCPHCRQEWDNFVVYINNKVSVSQSDFSAEVRTFLK